MGGKVQPGPAGMSPPVGKTHAEIEALGLGAIARAVAYALKSIGEVHQRAALQTRSRASDGEQCREEPQVDPTDIRKE